MKKILFALILLITNAELFAQVSKVIYSDSIGYPATENSFFTKKTVDIYTTKALEKKFNAKNELLQSTEYSNYTKKIKNGYLKTYYADGAIKSITNYKQNRKIDAFTSYYNNGQIKEEGEFTFDDDKKTTTYLIKNYYSEAGLKLIDNGNGTATIETEYGQETGSFIEGLKEGKWEGLDTRIHCNYVEEYKNGICITGYCMNNNQKISYTEPYKGITTKSKKGIADFYDFLLQKLDFSKYNIKLFVLVQFNVTKNGKIEHIIIENTVFPEIESKIISILNEFNGFKPAVVRGIPIDSTYFIPIQLEGVEE
ncbi:hypothetical protein [Flavobacterium sp. N1719]|uniref:hypothetical protein n=1 Tax=Flavobacterium sp. N1719 TaxID=2885633 RepID=UPI002223C1F2|nr:hypothetical protein [Flavobacterium sp. N1719]